MTQAGEKLYGDWERRHLAPWRRWVGRAALLMLAIGFGWAALFGFG